MCIIVYKPSGVDLPPREILENCYNYNSDGAGFMFVNEKAKKVEILKGFNDFEKFYKTAKKYLKTDAPAVLHFRISTQGGTAPELTHPYSICDNYDKMKKLKAFCDVGLAHNGVITLTSEGARYVWDKNLKKSTKIEPDYNDTMKFIKEYASLIITNPDYYKNKSNLLLLQRLCKSKLAIMSNDNHVELIGDFILDDETKCYYSNNSYENVKITYKYNSVYDNYTNNKFWNAYKTAGGYDFDYTNDFDCPCEFNATNIPYYCNNCKNYNTCKSAFKSTAYNIKLNERQ